MESHAHYESGLIERIGVAFLKRRQASRKKDQPERQPSDDELVGAADAIARWSMGWSFVAGVLSALGSTYIALIYDEADFWLKYGALIGSAVGCTAIELLFLFWLSLIAVHKLAELTGRNQLYQSDENLPAAAQVVNLLARAALEVADPAIRALDVDPLARVSKSQAILFGLLYKGKVFLSNFAAKLVLRQIFGRALLRVSIDYISAPISGLWNALVMRRILREARLRLFGCQIANFVADEMAIAQNEQTLSLQTQLGCLRAVATAIVLTQNAHPNMIVLLMRLKKQLDAEPTGDLDDWELFLETLKNAAPKDKFLMLDLLAISAAFDGRVSRLERRHLSEAFGQHDAVYLERINRLTGLIRRGRLNEAQNLCHLDFVPG